MRKSLVYFGDQTEINRWFDESDSVETLDPGRSLPRTKKGTLALATRKTGMEETDIWLS